MAKSDGNGEKEKSKFDEFSKFYVEYQNAKNAAGAKDASGRLNARGYAASFLHSVGQDSKYAEQATPENLRRIASGDQFSIDQALSAAQMYHSERLKAVFKPDSLEDIVSDIPRDKIVKNLVKYEPVEIKGDKRHNEIAALHRAYQTFLMAEKGDEKAAKAVGEIVANYFGEEAVASLEKKFAGDKHLSDYTRKVVIAVVSGIFARYPLSEERFKEYAEKAKKSIYDEFKEQFRYDSERVNYAVKNISAGAKEVMKRGDEGFDKAAQMIYAIGNMEDGEKNG